MKPVRAPRRPARDAGPRTLTAALMNNTKGN
jgi:hypothetical protein